MATLTIMTSYEVIESHAQTGEKGVKPPSSWNAPAIAEWLAGHVRDVTGRDMDHAVDLFEQGFDRYVMPSQYSNAC